MKKGLLSILAGVLVVVGCQNYDDQFDSLESQISALASTVAGLSQVQSDLASLSGTVASLASTVNGLGSQIDTAVADGLADIQADIADIEAAVADVASSEAVDALAEAVANSQEDLDELLANSSVFQGDVTINSPQTLEAFHAMGSTLAIVNGNVDIDVTTEMDIEKVQEVVDNILNVTGSFDYAAAESTIAEVTFTNLSGTQSLTLKQAGGYDLPALVSATVITLNDSFESKIESIDLSALTSVTRFFTSTDTDTVEFNKATSINIGALGRYPQTALTLESDEGGSINIDTLDDVDADGDQSDLTLSVTGPATLSLTNITDGSITLTDVDTASISGFRGSITIKGGVEDLTIVDGVTVSVASATDLTTANVTMKLDDDPDLSTATKAHEGGDLDFSNLTDLETVTVGGVLADLTFSGNSNLTEVTVSADMDDLSISNCDDLTSVDVSAATIHDVTFTGNDDIESLTLDHTTGLTRSAATAELAGSLTLTSNLKLASLVYSADKIDNLVITGNSKLATADFTGLATIGNTTATVNITSNNFTATKAKDDYNAATAADAGSFTTESKLGTLKTYLIEAIKAPSASGVKVYFDIVEATDVQSTSGGSYTENTSYTVDQTSASNYGAIVNVTQSTSSGRAVAQTSTIVLPIKKTWDGVINADTALGVNDDIDVTLQSGTTLTFDQNDAFTSAEDGANVKTVSDMIAYINANTSAAAAGFTLTAARDAAPVARYKISWTVSGTAAQVTTTGGAETKNKVYATFGTNPLTGEAINLVGTITDATAGVTNVVAALADEIEQLAAYTATSTGWSEASGSEIIVAALVSGTSYRDVSSIGHSLPTLAIDTATVSSNELLWGNDTDNEVAGVEIGSTSNTTAIASSLFSLSIDKNVYNNMRITLSSSNNAVNMATAGATITIDASSSTLATETAAQSGYYDFLTELSSSAHGGANGITLVAGTNIAPTSVTSSTLDYVAGFTDIESVTTTAGNDTDRTGWL